MKQLGATQKEVLDFFNDTTGRRFQDPKGLATILNLGFSIEDIKLVIMYQSQQWMGTEMKKYLRPETLFRKSKFEGYLNDAIQNVDKNKKEEKQSNLTKDIPFHELHSDTSWANGLI